MKSYNCLIVDDEVAAHEVLKNYIARHNYLKVIGQAYDAYEALEKIKEENVDILFLDINMPEMSGLEFILTLKNPPRIVLTTAYSEYALDAYDMGVVDYLVKPIPYNRFLKSIHKVISYQNEEINKKALQNITLKIDGLNKVIEYKDILYFQALGNYIKVITSTKSYISILTMQELETKLDTKYFIRVHKSYIAPIAMLPFHVNFQKLIISNNEIPIGRSYKVALKKLC